MSGKRFLGLDGLRGVCALTVLLFHAANLFHHGPIFQHGYLAVDMFFLLSGFVIAFIHEDRLKSGMSLTAFLLMVPTVSETLRRVPDGHPLVTDLKSPLLLGAQGVLLLILVIGLAAQIRWLRRRGRPAG